MVSSTTARGVVILLAITTLTLVLVTMVEKKSVFYTGQSRGCGVFQCANGEKKPNKLWLGDAGPCFEAAQAFSILTCIVVGTAILAHLLQLGSLLPHNIAQHVKYLHLAGFIFALVFWVLLLVAFVVDGGCGTGCSISDRYNINYGIFLGAVAMVCEMFAFFLYRRTSWHGSYTSF